MAWYDGLFTGDSGLNDQDKGKLANQGLLQAGLGILASNGQRGVTPFQAIAGGLLGGIGSVQQGTADIQNQRYKSAIEQSTLANMQRQQQAAQQADQRQKDLAQAFQDNTDASGNVNYDSALRQYGKSHPEDYANAKQQIYGGAPKIQDTPQGAVAIYPNGNYEFLHPSDVQAVQNAAQTASAMPQSIPAPSGAPGGGSSYTPPPPLLAAQQQVESGGNPNAVSSAGAIGPMQTLPSTLRDPGFGVLPARNNTPAELLRVGNDYSTALQQKYGQIGGLAAYNWGPGNWDKALAANGGNVQAALASAPTETQNYVPKVLGTAGLPQGANPSQLPAGRISLGTKAANPTSAERQKYDDVMALTGDPAQALQAGYGIKPAKQQALENPESWDDGLTQDQKNIVQGLSSYKYPVSARFLQTPANQLLISRAQMLNPDLNVPQYTAIQKQVSDFASNSPTSAGGTVLAANTALGHLSRLSEISDNLPDAGKLLNGAYNAYSNATGWGDNKNLTDWKSATQLFSGELAKLVKGGVASEGEVKGILDNLNASNTKEGRNAALQVAGEFLEQRVQALEAKRDDLLGSLSPKTSLLTQNAQSSLANLYKKAGREAPTLAPVGPALGYKRGAGDNLMTSPQVAGSGNSSLDAIMSQYGSK